MRAIVGGCREWMLWTVLPSVCLVLGGAVPALPAWEPPVTISDAGRNSELPQLAIDKKGNAIVVWERADDNGTPETIQAAFRLAGGTFAAADTISGTGRRSERPQVAVDKKGNALAVWEGEDETETSRIEAAFRPAGGTFTAAVILSEAGENASNPQVAFDKKGNALVVWDRFVSPNRRIQVAFRPKDGAFGAPESISDPGENGDEPQVAFDKKGNALVVWYRVDAGGDYRIEAAFRPKDGTFEAPVTVSNASTIAGYPQLAVDGKGNALVTWYRYDGTNLRVESAFRPKDGPFETPVTLSDAGEDASLGEAAFDKKGNALAVWGRFDGTSDRVQAALRPKDGTFGAADTISAPGPDAVGPRVVFDKKRNALVVWHRYSNITGRIERIEAALRAAEGAFAAGETISDTGQDAADAQVTFDRKGNALAVWDRSDGTDVRIQAAFRPRD